MATPPTGTVTVTRRISAPAERVFDAWLDFTHAARWLFATPTGTIVHAEIDPRVGGKFLFTDRRDGVDVEHVGQYLEISRPRRLVFTFGVPMFSPLMTRVTIDIAPAGNACELTLTHEGVLPEYLDKVPKGWQMILDGLATNVETNDPSKT